MNREILFRGKRIDNGKWIEGFYAECDERAFIMPEPDCDISKHMLDGYWLGAFYEVIPSTVGQYTGLTDKNGNKIFEGDILEVRVRDKEKMAKMEYDSFLDPTKKDVWSVEYRERYSGGNGYYFYGKDRRFSTRATNSTIWNCDASIIGNIHDNPELLS